MSNRAIQISAHLKPFSHLPGVACVIPFSPWQLRAYPTLLRFTSLITGEGWEEKLSWKGSIDGFTVELDLEKGCIAVFGQSAGKFVRLWVEATSKGMKLSWDKEKKEKVISSAVRSLFPSHPLENLSLGKHTKLDWELVWRRMNLEEIVPVLFRLGQMVPSSTAQTASLRLIATLETGQVLDRLTAFFKVGFHGMLAPRLRDEEFQGIVEETETQGSPLALLTSGYQAIRNLFFKEQLSSFDILPHLPPAFHAGRLVNLRSSQGDILALEWSKKVIRRIEILPGATREIFLCLQTQVHSYRINKKITHKVEQPLFLEAGRKIFLDRFEK